MRSTVPAAKLRRKEKEKKREKKKQKKTVTSHTICFTKINANPCQTGTFKDAPTNAGQTMLYVDFQVCFNPIAHDHASMKSVKK